MSATKYAMTASETKNNGWSIGKTLALFSLFALAASAPAEIADIGVSKVGLPEPVGAGSNLTYTVTVTNAGPNDATLVVLNDTLPSQVDYVSYPAVAWL